METQNKQKNDRLMDRQADSQGTKLEELVIIRKENVKLEKKSLFTAIWGLSQ